MNLFLQTIIDDICFENIDFFLRNHPVYVGVEMVQSSTKEMGFNV